MCSDREGRKGKKALKERVPYKADFLTLGKFPSSIWSYISHMRDSREGQRTIKVHDCNNIPIILITALKTKIVAIPFFLYFITTLRVMSRRVGDQHMLPLDRVFSLPFNPILNAMLLH